MRLVLMGKGVDIQNKDNYFMTQQPNNIVYTINYPIVHTSTISTSL
jgi:hypothetical protein